MDNLPEHFVNQRNHIQSMTVLQRTTIINTDGTSYSHEKSLEHISEKNVSGDSWMINPFVSNRDLPEDHKRFERSSSIAKETFCHTDKNGVVTKKESAVKKDDNLELLGTKSIGFLPEPHFDPRNRMIDAFSSGADPFSLLTDNYKLPRQITSNDEDE
jgi:hypothetical protein